ncbi:MAG TPA: metal-dependent hydrolase [Thermoanaerobaculia bacterium]|nr:metal-dependent hydrolase [Thermoanaerobaculia bacterium]
MNVIEHFLIGWCIANVSPELSGRDRTIVTVAAVIPDVDGLGLLVEIPTRNTAHPLLWWTEYHHVLGHNIGFALFVAAIACVLATKRLQTTALAVVSFHSHILGDILGARGPDGYQWPIPYFLPFSPTPQLSWQGQWALNAWQNFVITGVALAMTFLLAWRRGYSPIGIFSKRADARFVETLRDRFGTPGL